MNQDFIIETFKQYFDITDYKIAIKNKAIHFIPKMTSYALFSKTIFLTGVPSKVKKHLNTTYLFALMCAIPALYAVWLTVSTDTSYYRSLILIVFIIFILLGFIKTIRSELIKIAYLENELNKERGKM